MEINKEAIESMVKREYRNVRLSMRCAVMGPGSPIQFLVGRAALWLSALLFCSCFYSVVAGAAERNVPVIPPKEKQIRVIIDSDAKNEIDDQWAIALAILSPERFKIEGFVAAPYLTGGPEGVEKSAKEIELILDKAGMQGKWPVKRGSQPLQYPDTPNESEGVDFIIEKAMASTPDDPLWIVGLGAATNIASAYIKEPKIADRVVVFWHFRTRCAGRQRVSRRRCCDDNPR